MIWVCYRAYEATLHHGSIKNPSDANRAYGGYNPQLRRWHSSVNRRGITRS